MVIIIKTKTSQWNTTRRFLFLYCQKTPNNLIFMTENFMSKFLRMVLSIVFLGLLVCVARELLSFSKFNSCFQNEVLTKQKSQLQTKLLIRYFQNQTTYQLNLGSNQNHIIRLFWLVCLGSGYYYPVAKWGPI